MTSWSVMIYGLSKREEPTRALELFDSMPIEYKVEPNAVSLLNLLHVVGKSETIEFMKFIVGMNQLIFDGFGNCSDLVRAKQLFEEMPQRYLASWNTIVRGFLRICELGLARKLLDELVNILWWIPWSDSRIQVVKNFSHGMHEIPEAKIVLELGKEFNVDEVYGGESSFIGSLKSVNDFNPVEVSLNGPINFDERMFKEDVQLPSSAQGEVAVDKAVDDEEEKEKMKIRDEIKTNLINLRRTIYLTIMSSVDFEEDAHKLLKIKLESGQEMELCIMLLECCSQERTYLRYYGLMRQRFCMMNKVYQENFEILFVQQYSIIHRLETNKLWNMMKFFAHLLGTNALPWHVLAYIRLTKEDTTSSSCIFINILFEELSEHLVIRLLDEHRNDPTMQDSFEFIINLNSLSSSTISQISVFSIGSLSTSLVSTNGGSASAEIKSAQDAATLIDEKRIFIVGIFPKLSREEFNNFTKLAEKLRSDYDFGHTQDANHLSRGEAVSRPTLRLLKPFDKLFVDSQDFQVDALEKFIEEATIPLVTIFDENPENYSYVNNFFESPNVKAMFFLDFSNKRNTFESKYHDAAAFYKGTGISFLMGDVVASENAFRYFGLAHDQAPLLILQHNDGHKFLKPNIQPDQIAHWLKDYKDDVSRKETIQLVFKIELIRIQLRVPEYGWTTQKFFHLMNFIANGVCDVVFGFHK